LPPCRYRPGHECPVLLDSGRLDFGPLFLDKPFCGKVFETQRIIRPVIPNIERPLVSFISETGQKSLGIDVMGERFLNISAKLNVKLPGRSYLGVDLAEAPPAPFVMNQFAATHHAPLPSVNVPFHT